MNDLWIICAGHFPLEWFPQRQKKKNLTSRGTGESFYCRMMCESEWKIAPVQPVHTSDSLPATLRVSGPTPRNGILCISLNRWKVSTCADSAQTRRRPGGNWMTAQCRWKSSQRATLYDTKLINWGMTWGLPRADCTMKASWVSKRKNKRPSGCAIHLCHGSRARHRKKRHGS